MRRVGPFSFGEFLDAWLLAVLKAANEAGEIVLGGHDARSHLQNALQDIIDGGSGVAAASEPLVRWLPRVGVRVERGRVLPEFERSDAHVLFDEETLHAIIIALATDPRSRRLRRCDWKDCRAFFLAKADHRRAHSFCRDEHRRAYDVAHRDPEQIAKYMQEYRRILKRKRKTKTTRRRR